MAGNAPHDLYFEVLRQKTHLFLDAKETSTVRDLKLMIEGILKLNPTQVELWRLDEEGSKILLIDSKMLAESGFSPSNCKPQKPAVIGILVKGEDKELDIQDVSVPPPIPESMRPEAGQQGPIPDEE